jgi:hypothetical protein
MKTFALNRRAFLRRSVALAVGTPLALRFPASVLAAEAVTPVAANQAPRRTDAKVALVSCRSYGSEVRTALAKAFDLLGGVGSLVKNKTVTIKVNLTGTDFTPITTPRSLLPRCSLPPAPGASALSNPRPAGPSWPRRSLWHAGT